MLYTYVSLFITCPISLPVAKTLFTLANGQLQGVLGIKYAFKRDEVSISNANRHKQNPCLGSQKARQLL